MKIGKMHTLYCQSFAVKSLDPLLNVFGGDVVSHPRLIRSIRNSLVMPLPFDIRCTVIVGPIPDGVRAGNRPSGRNSSIAWSRLTWGVRGIAS